MYRRKRMEKGNEEKMRGEVEKWNGIVKMILQE